MGQEGENTLTQLAVALGVEGVKAKEAGHAHVALFQKLREHSLRPSRGKQVLRFVLVLKEHKEAWVLLVESAISWQLLEGFNAALLNAVQVAVVLVNVQNRL